MTVLLGVFVGADAAGTAAGRCAVPTLIALLAFGFGGGGNGLRVIAIVLATLAALFALSGVASKLPPGFLGVVAGLAIVCALCRPSAAEWFKRGR